MAENIYSCFHYHKKCQEDRQAIEELAPKIMEAASNVAWGNVGDIKYTARTDVPNGGAWCDGAAYAKEDYPDVYKLLADGKLVSVDMTTFDSSVNLNGSCGFFGLDDTGFKVPLLKDVYLKAGQEADEFGAESLPNIKGEMVGDISQANATGALKLTNAYNGAMWQGSTSVGRMRDWALDASRSSLAYQNGAKVNPDHVKYRAYVVLFLAEKELSIVNWTNQLDKKTAENIAQIDAKGDSYLDKTQITNCITEIPQDIKLELNDGTLTLKAGSKVYVPNGKNADGLLKFDEVVTESDVTVSGSRTSTAFTMLDLDDGVIDMWTSVAVSSGSATPTPPGNVFIWYDTANNIFKVTSDKGVTWTVSRCSLPFGIVAFDSASITSIDQVFNGFGYIGSTMFALPGVKGLIPNGRNEDGSLKNVEVVSSKVRVRSDINPNVSGFFALNGTFDHFIDWGVSYELTDDNYLNTSYGDKVSDVVSGLFVTDSSGKITSFSPKQAFQAVDRNDSSWIAQQAMPSSKYIDLTLGANGATYTAPANGWLYFAKKSTASNQFIQISRTESVLQNNSYSSSSGQYLKIHAPVTKGEVLKIDYSAAGSDGVLKFYFAEGEN